MNYKKIVLFFIIFMCLLGVGSMLSNVQSREADQLLEAHGLSNNTRYIEVNRNETISDFLRYLDKYKNANIQLHLDNRYDNDQVLVWANHNVINLPTQNGRYFTPDDFEGQVSFAVLGPETKNVQITESQGNQYLNWNNDHYSVIGDLKHYHQMEQNKYYLSTGIDQPTAKNKLKDYRIIIDSSNKVIHKIAKHYHVKVNTPSFVKNHQIHRFSILKEIAIILLFWIFIVVCNGLLAFLNIQQLKKSHLRGHLSKNWIINRSVQLILLESLISIGAYTFLRWRAFFSKPDHLIGLIILSFIIIMVSYLISIIYLWRKYINNAQFTS